MPILMPLHIEAMQESWTPPHTQGCMPWVPLDMPICCPSVFPSMQVASGYARMLPKCFPRYASRSSSSLYGSKQSQCTGENQVLLLVIIRGENPMSTVKAVAAGKPCGLRLLTPALVNLSLVSRLVGERNHGQNNRNCEEPLKESAFSC